MARGGYGVRNTAEASNLQRIKLGARFQSRPRIRKSEHQTGPGSNPQ